MEAILNQSEVLELRRYLLGQLTTDEEEQVELRLLTDGGYAEELDIVVDEITDEYIANELPPEELELAESHFFQSQERREKLEFVKALRDYQTNIDPTPRALTNQTMQAHERVAVEPVHTPSFLHTITTSWLVRVAAVVVAVGLLVLVVWPPANRSPQYLAVTLNLTAANRGNQAAPASKIILPQTTDVLRVTLVLSEGLRPDANYRVQLVSGNGETGSLNITGREGNSVVVEIPRSQLNNGSYAMKLFTIGANGSETPIPGSYLFVIQ